MVPTIIAICSGLASIGAAMYGSRAMVTAAREASKSEDKKTAVDKTQGEFEILRGTIAELVEENSRLRAQLRRSADG